MARRYKECLQALMDEVSGRPIGEITEDELERLNAAGGREDEDQQVFNCTINDCSMEMRTQVIASKLLVMSSDVRSNEQPCAE